MIWQVQLRSCSNGLLANLPTCYGIRYLWFANTVDTLSAIKCNCINRKWNGYIYDYETIGEYPRWGEDDPSSNRWLNGWLKLTQLVCAATNFTRTLKQQYHSWLSHLTLLTLNKLVTHQFTRCYLLNEDGGVNLSKLNSSHPGANHLTRQKGGWLQTWTHSLDFSYAAADGIYVTTQVHLVRLVRYTTNK